MDSPQEKEQFLVSSVNTRLFFEDIEKEDSWRRAKQYKEVVLAQGIEIVSVYFMPDKMDMLFIKKKGVFFP